MFNPSLAPVRMALCNKMLETDLMEKSTVVLVERDQYCPMLEE